MTEKSEELVIFASANGRDGWHPVKPGDVPAWVKEPDTMGRLVAGETAMKADEGDKGSDWYAAMPTADAEAYLRLNRAQRRALH